MMNREQIQRTRFLSGWLKRYHAWPTLSIQTLAHHQWRVATLLVEIFGMPRAEVLYYALWHDGGEFFSGDVPYQAKGVIPGMRETTTAAENHGLDLLGIKLPELSPLEKVQVKIADLIEMHEYGRMEVLMGNHFCIPVMDDTILHAQRIARENGLETAVETWIGKNHD